MLSAIPVIAAATASLLGVAHGCSIVSGVKVTYYGSPDNDPPGDATAYNCGGRDYHAGGVGTYANPLSFATAPGEYNECEIVYFPYMKKYLRMEDYCQACYEDYESGIKHIDIWTGNSTSGGDPETQCENALTPDNVQSVIRSPATSLAVNTAALWDGKKCHTEDIYPTYTASSYCSGSTTSTAAASTPTCQTGCSWSGHCIGCSCKTYDDCSDDYICVSGRCAA
ncbi:hypothetical protein VMCG_01201 [Cytospora schulzeri]|uniref:Chitin-binding type-4 domain-containing protein n=1 Tax=Cytospora schulzeri TaxID=448051 RepID=A0A423X6U5_9PEZI|nr:hypothetical protein VMCG_01201 [Valsa malicola]